MIRRRPLRTLLLVSVLLLVGLGWHNRAHLQAFPDIISAYTAKEYCSCRYVMNNPAPYCDGYVSQYVPVSQLLDDQSRKRVTASGLGRSNSAVWLGPRQGCQLLPAASTSPPP
ncbi:amidase [Pseudomonas sp. SA3-5]|uniref:Amidase n=1 Tax=Pseudomonas aestuarii TaxID=3018340 RepID=A0ABT4XGF1_9PSED|nr:amidase [Pseudomonas aestuarii]MDA7087242.1 amidase [Pseudomonas aestuarii]